MQIREYVPSYGGGHGPRGVKGLIIYTFLQKMGFLVVNYSATGSKIVLKLVTEGDFLLSSAAAGVFLR